MHPKRRPSHKPRNETWVSKCYKSSLDEIKNDGSRRKRRSIRDGVLFLSGLSFSMFLRDSSFSMFSRGLVFSMFLAFLDFLCFSRMGVFQVLSWILPR